MHGVDAFRSIDYVFYASSWRIVIHRLCLLCLAFLLKEFHWNELNQLSLIEMNSSSCHSPFPAWWVKHCDYMSFMYFKWRVFLIIFAIVTHCYLDSYSKCLLCMKLSFNYGVSLLSFACVYQLCFPCGIFPGVVILYR